MAKYALEKSTKTNKQFSYKKNAVELSFTLRIDNSSELKPFRDCLKQALYDVELTLEDMKN